MIREGIQKLNRLVANKHGRDFGEVFSGSIIALLVQMMSACGAFFLNVIIARHLGVTGTGVYYTVISIVTAGFVVSRFGLDLAAMRYISRSIISNEVAIIKKTYKLCALFILVFASLISLSIFILAEKISVNLFNNPELTIYVKICSFSIVPMSLVFLYGQMLRAVNRTKLSQLVNFTLNPFTALALLLVIVTFGKLSLELTLLTYNIGAVVALFFGIYFWHKQLRQMGDDTSVNAAAPSGLEILKSASPMFWVTVVGFVSSWASITILGLLAKQDEVGIFSVAFRTAFAATFFMKAFGVAIAPKAAKLHHQGNMEALEKIIKKTTRLMIALALPALIILIIFSKFIMGLYVDDVIVGSICLNN